MSEERIVKRTIRRTTVTGGDDDYDTDTRISKSHRSYQVYRGMSPSTSNRLELRIRELEDALEAERDGRLRAEKELSEIHFQFESVSERLEEADGLTSAQSEISRRREGEVLKLKKDFELLVVQQESSEASLRKRHQEALNDLSDQVDFLGKSKSKIEKEKQVLIVEIDGLSTSYDQANKARAHAESKVDGLEDALRKLKAQVDEFARQNGELNNIKVRITTENFELQRTVQDLDSSNGALSKAKSQLQAALDEAKSRLEEESRQRQSLSVQVANLQVDLDNSNARLDEESENAAALRAQLSRTQGDYQVLKSKYEKDMMSKTEELEDVRRRLNARIAELEDTAATALSRAAKLEKDKNRLQIELREVSIEFETAQAQVQDLAKRLKAAESANGELARRVEELSHELSTANGENQRLNVELAKLKQQYNDLQDRFDALSRENKQLSDNLREANSANKDLNRQNQELIQIRISLEAERDNLAAELADTRDALKDAQARLDAANNALSSLRVEMESRLREKDDEIENIRKSGQRALDELQRTIIELETRFKTEISRLKKKYEAEFREFEIQVETLSRANGELGKNNKALGARVKELEVSLDEERRAGDEARAAVTVLERRRIALTTELEDVRALLETSERARKGAEGELHESSTRVNELNILITGLTGDKRRMEGDLTAIQSELDESSNARRSAEDRADRLQIEVHRFTEDLRQEQDNYKNAEGLRKQLEVEIREITVRLEEAEAFAQKEGKRMVAKLQARLRDLEAEYELEQRRSRELAAANRKLERALAEIRVQADDDRRMVIELSDSVNTCSTRIKILKRQLEEAEEVVTITMNKYRKGQSMLEEAEHRADLAEKNFVSIRGRGRSMSVTREITRVVRV